MDKPEWGIKNVPPGTVGCHWCGRLDCKNLSLILCPICCGATGKCCADQLVPGLVPGSHPEGGNILVCSEFGDPEVDAILRDNRQSLIEMLIHCRDQAIQEQEG